MNAMNETKEEASDSSASVRDKTASEVLSAKAGSARKHPIDEFRRKLVANGLTHEAAGIATGLAADYAMGAYCEGYSKGYNDGHAEGKVRRA